MSAQYIFDDLRPRTVWPGRALPAAVQFAYALVVVFLVVSRSSQLVHGERKSRSPEARSENDGE